MHKENYDELACSQPANITETYNVDSQDYP